MEEHRFPGGTGLSSGGSAMVVLNNNSGPGKLGPMANTFDANAQMSGGQQQPGGLNKQPQYTMAGILQFLQTEWAKFEVQKASWDMERAELQARIAFLDGERRAQENLKRDLVRRIKMLEYALKQERSKFHKLRYGVDLDFNQPSQNRKAVDSQNQSGTNANHASLAENGGLANIAQARQVLRTYLREVGYTDTILDVRNVRVRQLLGLQSGNTPSNAPADIDRVARAPMNAGAERANSGSDVRAPQSVMRVGKQNSARSPAEHDRPSGNGNGKGGSGPAMDSGTARPDDDTLFESANDATFAVDDLMVSGDADEQEVLAEFDYLVNEQDAGQPLDSLISGTPAAPSGDSSGGTDGWHVDQNVIQSMKDAYVKGRRGRSRGVAQHMMVNLSEGGQLGGSDLFGKSGSDDFGAPRSDFASELDDAMGEGDADGDSEGEPLYRTQADREDLNSNERQLGELADLNVGPNCADDETGGDGGGPRNEARSWTIKYTLRSHFDGVRAVAFHPYDSALLTASEDSSVKYWSLQRTVQSKKTAALDVEPICTFRAHTAPVLCLAVNQAGTHAFSAGLDKTIRVWHLPSIMIDQYDPYDPSILVDTLEGHSDSVWSLAVHPSQPHLLSASADGSIRLWSVANQASLVNTYSLFSDDLPTSVCYQQTDPSQCLVATRSGHCYSVDLERGVAVCHFEVASDDAELGISERASTPGGRCAYRVVSQPMTPACVCAYEDRTIRFFDTLTGRQTHSMVAHLDAVTSLAIDPSGLYLLSGSHDSSIRIWTLESRSCVQEITAHRKKFAESIHDLATHPHKPLFASAGADALAKVFTA